MAIERATPAKDMPNAGIEGEGSTGPNCERGYSTPQESYKNDPWFDMPRGPFDHGGFVPRPQTPYQHERN